MVNLSLQMESRQRAVVFFVFFYFNFNCLRCCFANYKTLPDVPSAQVRVDKDFIFCGELFL